jgi:quercetin dioxygenase-like cupin family protein
MYSKINVEEASERTRSDTEPTLRALGYEIRADEEERPNEIRFNYFEYEQGQAVRRHKQLEQEELYFVTEGRAKMTVGDEDFDITEGDAIVVDAGVWRQITALKDCEVFAVGAPNVTDDAVFDAD